MYFYAELNDKAATVSDVSLSIDNVHTMSHICEGFKL